ncbi:HD domain-containing protein [Streptomyces sp. 3213]|nr:HD domain-containing protein [Streptomyces sp. 3213] [Streptomyces sp. 3213.3]
MCLFHDSQETRVGDIPHIGRKYIRAVPNEEVTADQVANAHPAAREGVQRAVDEYEAGETPEAIVAHDADKLECLVQAVEYREQGYSLTQNWIETSLAELRRSRRRPSPTTPCRCCQWSGSRTYCPDPARTLQAPGRGSVRAGSPSGRPVRRGQRTGWRRRGTLRQEPPSQRAASGSALPQPTRGAQAAPADLAVGPVSEFDAGAVAS